MNKEEIGLTTQEAHDKEVEKSKKILKRRVNELKLDYAISNEDLRAIETIISAYQEEKEKREKAEKELEKYIVKGEEGDEL